MNEAAAKKPYKRTFTRKIRHKVTARVISLAPYTIFTLQPHGAREMERRKRQIADGRLKVENGLMV